MIRTFLTTIIIKMAKKRYAKRSYKKKVYRKKASYRASRRPRADKGYFEKITSGHSLDVDAGGTWA